MYYVYKITNLINDKIYVGYHWSPDITNDKYLGSGVNIIKAVKKYGPDNFKREIIAEFKTLEDALDLEKEIVNEEFVLREDTYNLAVGGNGGFPIGCAHNINKIGMFCPKLNKNVYVTKDDLESMIEMGYIVGSSTKGRIAISKGNSISYCQQEDLEQYLNAGWSIGGSSTSERICISHRTYGLKYIPEDEITQYLNSGWVRGNLYAGINKGKIFINNGKINKRINHDELQTYTKLGWYEGRKQVCVKGWKKVFNSKTGEVKQVSPEAAKVLIESGWEYGNGNKKQNLYKKLINNGVESKMISLADLDIYTKQGWKLGQLKK